MTRGPKPAAAVAAAVDVAATATSSLQRISPSSAASAAKPVEAAVDEATASVSAVKKAALTALRTAERCSPSKRLRHEIPLVQHKQHGAGLSLLLEVAATPWQTASSAAAEKVSRPSASHPSSSAEAAEAAANASSPMRSTAPPRRVMQQQCRDLLSQPSTPISSGRSRPATEAGNGSSSSSNEDFSLDAVPLPFRPGFEQVAAAAGPLRLPQLAHLFGLLGDLRAPLPLIQVVGAAGSGKSFLLRLLLSECSTAHGYADAAAAAAVDGSAGRHLLYLHLLRSLAAAIKEEAEACCEPIFKLQQQLQQQQQQHAKQGAEGSGAEAREMLQQQLAVLQQQHKLLLQECRRASQARVTTPDGFVEILVQQLAVSAGTLTAAAAAAAAGAASGWDGAAAAQQEALSRAARSVVLVVDGAEPLRQLLPELLQALLRLPELLYGDNTSAAAAAADSSSGSSRGVCIVLICRRSLPAEALDGLPPPPLVRFAAYGRDEAAFVLQRSFQQLALPLMQVAMASAPPGFPFSLSINMGSPVSHAAAAAAEEEAGVWLVSAKTGRTDVLQIWRQFCGDICRCMHQHAASDFWQLRFLCRELWGQALQLLLRTKQLGALNLMHEQLRSSCAAAAAEPFSRLLPDLVDCRVNSAAAASVWGGQLAAADSAARLLQLPWLSRLLLVAAFLAAYTSRKADKRLLKDTLGNSLLLYSRSKPRKAPEEAFVVLQPGVCIPKALPKTFSLVRWLSLAELLQKQPLVLECPSLLQHVSSLLRLGLVAVHAPALMHQQRTAAAAGGPTWLHSAGWLVHKTKEARSAPSAAAASAARAAAAGGGFSGGGSDLLQPTAKLTLLADTEVVVTAAQSLKLRLDELL